MVLHFSFYSEIKMFTVFLDHCAMMALDQKKLYCSFLWIGCNCLKARATLRRQFTFYH